MKSLETCIEDCQQRGAKIGLWSAQLEAIKAAFKLPVTGDVAWFRALYIHIISAVQRCQMIHPLLPMMKGNLEQVNTICGDSECVKVHSPKHEVQTSVGFAIVMAWGQYKIPCFVERQDTTLLLIIKIGYHWYQSVNQSVKLDIFQTTLFDGPYYFCSVVKLGPYWYKYCLTPHSSHSAKNSFLAVALTHWKAPLSSLKNTKRKIWQKVRDRKVKSEHLLSSHSGRSIYHKWWACHKKYQISWMDSTQKKISISNLWKGYWFHSSSHCMLS